MKTSPANNKFVPMRRSFLVLYASVICILLAFIMNGFWFSTQIAGLSEAVNLAGSERMRIFKIAFLIANASDEASPGRDETLGQVNREMIRFEEILAELRGGSSRYRIKKFPDQAINAILERLAASWLTEFKPKFNTIILASPEKEKRFLLHDQQQIQTFVEKEIDHLVQLLVTKMNQAEHLFLLSRGILSFICIIVLYINLLYLRRRIIQPLNALMRDTEQMAAGNHAVRAEVCANNEFMLFAQRFNAMAAAISSSFAHMEETIRLRSNELNASNTKMQAYAEHLRLLMDSTGEGIYGIDMTGCCTFINRAGAAMVGYTPEELLGREMHETIHHSKPDGSPYPGEECPISCAFRTGVAAHVDNEWLWRKDHSSLPVEYASYPIVVNGVISGAVITFSDISEVIKAREERNKLFNAVEQSEESIIITDLKGTIEYVNPAFERKTGYSVAEALGQNPKILNSGKQPHEFYERMWQTLSRGDIWSGELINKKKSGELYYEQVTISPVKNELRETTHYVAIKNDITARKLAEEEILQKNRELEQANHIQAEMMRDVQTAMHAAKAAARAKSDFLANMSHEIRTPMNAIMGMAHLLAKTPLDDSQLDYVGKIDSSTKGLLGIINDILDFSKIEAGKLDLESVPFSLEDVLKNLTNISLDKAQEKHLELVYSIANEVPMALIGDPLRLGQVLINLTGNAIKFTSQGKVTVTIEVAEQSTESVLLRFSIRDSGIGMTKPQMASLFQAFSQADTSTTRKFGGTGLGLTISKQLVELMGGKIGVTSEYGKGSTFFFTAKFARRHETMGRLPHDEGGLGMPALTADDQQQLRGAKVLVAEDNGINQQVAREILENAGVVVSLANNGEEAVDMAVHGNYDLILMDIQMPVMDGLAATEIIRRLSSPVRTVPIIAMTAHAMTGDRERSLAAGMDDHITKPIDPPLLFATLVKFIKCAQRELPGFRLHKVNVRQTKPLPPFADLPGIDTKSGLARVGGNQTLYQNLLVKFKQNFSKSSAELADLLARRETHPQALRLVHTIKGVAGNIGAEALAAVAAELEAEIKNDAATLDAAKALNKFDTALRHLLAGLSQVREKKGDDDALSKDLGSEGMLISLLDRLGPHLNVGAPKHCKTVLAELAHYDWPESYSAALRELTTLVARYKFKEAEEVMTALLRELNQ